MRKWAIAGGTLVVALIVLSVAVNRYARERAIRELKDRYGREVEIASLDVSILPRIKVVGEKLVYRKRGRRDVPPLITIQKFEARAGLLEMLRSPKHVNHVRLDGLVVTISRRADRPGTGEPKERKTESPVVVDQLACDDALVRVIPKDPRKNPLDYDIHRLRMQDIGLDRPAPFRASLRNAKPPGEIAVRGTFGPWRTDDPGQTPLAAKYEFKKADLGDFNGIGGILSAEGKIGGVLDRLVVDGETKTPDFVVDVSGHPVPLSTVFHAIVDGTDGDTLLKPVRARILRSLIVCDGGVVGKPGTTGKTVTLDVVADNARLEDILELAVKSDTMPMTGVMSFKTKFELPPGKQRVVERLRLDGAFGISQGEFASDAVRGKVEHLSRAGRGRPEENNAGTVVSNLRGRFRLSDGVLTLTGLNFGVPGASIALDGSYGLQTERIDFRGNVTLAAKPSQATTGAKSWLLKLLDPFLKGKQAGTVLPIKISGTRSSPVFGVDKGRALGGGK